MMETHEVNGNICVLTLDDYQIHCAYVSSDVKQPLAHSQSRARGDCHEKVL